MSREMKTLYLEVLKHGYNIRVIEGPMPGCGPWGEHIYWLETYIEKGWWVFKRKIPQRHYFLCRNGVIKDRLVYPINY